MGKMDNVITRISIAAEIAAAEHLRNTVLVLNSGDWTHDLALRVPTQRPAFKVDLARSKPYELDIASPPKLDNVFIEFIPSADSLAKALPNSVMSAKQGKMMIGLDAGENSLVILQFESKPRGRLRTTVWARETTADTRKPIKKGFERSLRTAMKRLNQNLLSLRAGVKKLKGKDAEPRRKLAEATIQQLEDRKRIIVAFRQSFQVAKAATLNFAIYRRLGERKLLLVQFGTPD